MKQVAFIYWEYVYMYMMGVTTVKETEAIHLKAIIECLLEWLEE